MQWTENEIVIDNEIWIKCKELYCEKEHFINTYSGERWHRKSEIKL